MQEAFILDRAAEDEQHRQVAERIAAVQVPYARPRILRPADLDRPRRVLALLHEVDEPLHRRFPSGPRTLLFAVRGLVLEEIDLGELVPLVAGDRPLAHPL